MTLVDDIARMRSQHRATHAERPCDQARLDDAKPAVCRWCHPDLNQLPAVGDTRPDTAEAWDARARMAAAKGTTGAPLTELETEALTRCPTPSRLSVDGYR